jgi:hypothetical protein
VPVPEADGPAVLGRIGFTSRRGSVTLDDAIGTMVADARPPSLGVHA